MSALAIAPLAAPPHAELRLPGSKSITNRCLLAAGLAEGTSVLDGLLLADDTEAMMDCVTELGATVRLLEEGLVEDGRRAEVRGTGGQLPQSGRVCARQSGTTARFVAPVLALSRGPWVLEGDAQLRARPMGDLFAALRDLGARVDDQSEPGRLPASIEGPVTARPVMVSGATSSQFLSGLLLAGPLLDGELTVTLAGGLVSRPFVELTMSVMRRFGADVSLDHDRYRVRPGGYRAAEVAIEPDGAAASYFFAAAALSGGSVRVQGLGRTSAQAEMAFPRLLATMGAEVEIGPDATEVRGRGRLHGVEADCSDFSDAVPTLAVVAAFADVPTRITGVGFIRDKESDRIGALAEELRRCGIGAVEEPDGLVIVPSPPHPALVRTRGDHRLAMAFSVLGLVTPGIEIDDPGCVAKTFPEFFATLEQLRERSLR
ncbi:MAG: 3-phosphoshikimate 1-carboxyvinyltransferase [Acidimicrobiales bacterium]|nr:3-phosphoshikimate 1-carboxyvinyltransferase [Acidimicrobiales bacterium]